MLVAHGGGGSGTYTIDDVAATLDAINVDPETIEAIVRILRMSTEELGSRTFEDIPAASFGGSAQGGQLGYHTHLAHQKVVEAMDGMMTDLTQVEQDVVSYRESQEYTDDMTRLAFERALARLSPLQVF